MEGFSRLSLILKHFQIEKFNLKKIKFLKIYIR